MRTIPTVAALTAVVLAACNAPMGPPEADAGMDAGATDASARDAASNDASSDAGADAGPTPAEDAGVGDAGSTSDGGPIRADGGPMSADGGSPSDAGPMSADAGPMSADAGSATDAGPMSADAGSPPVDAGGDAATCRLPAGPSPFTGCNPTTGIECDGDWAGECRPSCAASECCSPQSNRFRCVPRNADGTCPAADLWVDPTRLSPYIETRTFSPASCALAEGCVGGSGPRRLLRFDTWTPNTGAADMYLGAPSASSPYFEYSSCHRHYHFDSYAEYELLTSDEACVAAVGHKQAFCLLDYYEYPCDPDGTDPAVPDCRFIAGGYTCSNQGIRRDAQDVYDATLDCQWIDITGVPPGSYVIRIRINTENVLNESDYTNNEVRVPVTIP